MGSSAFAFQTDGRFDPNEGYTSFQTLDFALTEKSSGNVVQTITGGELRIGFDNPNAALGNGNNLHLYFSQPLSIVDNSYGANAIGWAGSSHGTHTLKDLVKSDMLDLQFFSDAGQANQVLDFTIDYIEGTVDSNKNVLNASRGPFGTGEPGKEVVRAGSAASVLAVGTSLDYNLNHSQSAQVTPLGISLLQDSPGTNADGSGVPTNYSDINANFSDWISEVAYEVEVDGDLFPNGFTTANMILGPAHDSPNKIAGIDKVIYISINGSPPPTGGGEVPEPATLALFGAGLFGLGVLRRRRRTTTG